MSVPDQESIGETKSAILKVIKKPVPTDKLLQRPPFKFIQDVIVAIIKTTKFKEDLYTEDELTADISKNRDGKIQFLQKAIDALEETLNEKLDVKASKIIAGLEVDKTNLFLRKLAEAASGANVSTKAPAKGKATSKIATSSSAQERKVSPVGKKNVSTVKPRETSAEKQQKAVKQSTVTQKEPRAAAAEKYSTKSDGKEATKQANAGPPELTVRPPTGSTGKGTSIPRPTTARAPPPRVVKKADADEVIAAMAAQEEQVRLKSGKGIKNVIVDVEASGSARDVNEDDDKLFVVDDGTSQFDGENASYFDMGAYDQTDSLDAKGSLTKQLASAKMQLSDQVTNGESGDESKNSLVALNEEKLRQNLQKLTRITNPFGRLLDALQEDVDFMFTEYRTWLDEYKRNSSLLESEMESDDSSLDKLRSDLDALDKSIASQMDQISSIKSSIGVKDDKLRRMIALAVSNDRK